MPYFLFLPLRQLHCAQKAVVISRSLSTALAIMYQQYINCRLGHVGNGLPNPDETTPSISELSRRFMNCDHHG